MNVINMSMRPVQVNTKFLNSLPPEWSKFVTGVKLARYLHTTNFVQLYLYLEQHEAHANETRLLYERYQDPLALSNTMIPQVHSSQSYSPINAAPQLDSGLVVPMFSQGDDPIACLNKAMAFLTPFKMAKLLCNKFKGGKDKIMLVLDIRPKRLRNAAWFKEKAMLAEAHESGQILDEEQLALLADLGIPNGQAAKKTIPNTDAF
ncbi:hypothetical protein Tco_0143642 [Tanacetum coccineum]